MATITKIRKLRTGKGGFTGQSASLDDIYLVRVDTQIDKFEFLELWVAAAIALNLPVPKVSFKQFGSAYVVCDAIDADNNGQRYLWTVVVKWKEVTESNSQDQTRPNPTPPTGATGVAPSADPDDWEPKATRRPVTVQQPAESLFYEEGYPGALGTIYDANTAAGKRSPFTNSAGIPYRDQLPPHQRLQSLWTIRWMQKAVPAQLIDAELHLNDADVTFAIAGHTENWAAKTAKIESVQLTQTKWGTTSGWEITLEILVDKDGHVISALDQGMTEAYFPGDVIPGPGGSTVVTEKKLVVITDNNKKPLPEPCNLDGEGKQQADGDPVYAKWRDFPLTDFTAVPLLNRLVS